MELALKDLLLAFFLALLGGVLYTIIGIIPGTDETATMAPITLILVLMGIPPVALFAWFIGISTAMQISHTIPTAMTALPGSTMAVPMVRFCNLMKRLGAPHIAMQKLAAGSLLGSFIAIIVATLFGFFLAPYGKAIAPYAGLIFTLGALLLAVLSRARWAALVALIPFSFLLQGLQGLAVKAGYKPLFISFFMGITIGPMIAELFSILVPKIKTRQAREDKNRIFLVPEISSFKGFYPSPLKILSPIQTLWVAITSAITSCTFGLSPVGTTVLFGEIVAARIKEAYKRLTTSLAVMDGITNATYIGETIIPLIAFGLPLSPMALGPAAPLFNAPPRFTIEPINNLHNYLTFGDYILYGLLGVIGGSLIAYPVAIRWARKGTELMLKVVSHEALIGAFLGLIIMLAYYEAGIIGIIVALTVALFGGILHTFFEVHTGIQFMAYYASSYLVPIILKAVGIGS